MERNSRKSNSAQSTVEYFLILVAVLAAIILSGFLKPDGQLSNAFRDYFTKASDTITVITAVN
jgi:Flp pilus assembly pilin Flp